jgi:hypothetical protein
MSCRSPTRKVAEIIEIIDASTFDGRELIEFDQVL